MKIDVGGAFHVVLGTGQGYPQGVVRGQVVEVPEADARRYCSGPDAIAELVQ
jgi:hypothetical protein